MYTHTYKQTNIHTYVIIAARHDASWPRVGRTQDVFCPGFLGACVRPWCRRNEDTVLYYTILYYTILYYTILYYTILYYTTLYCTMLCYDMI